MKHKIQVVITAVMLLIFSLTFFPEASAASGPVLTLNPISGTTGTATAITGNGFAPNTSGDIWFDINGNGIKDTGEPSRMISTTAAGEIPKFTRLTAPKAPGGNYKVLVDIPGGDAIEASADFQITPSISLSQKTGYSGTKVTISGSGFAAQTIGYIWFDTNGDGKRNDAEPLLNVTSDENGVISPDINLTTPATGPGTYRIQADMPDGNDTEASAEFTYAPTMALSPSPVTSNLGSVVMDTIMTISISGGGFNPDATGYIWFDYNKNGQRDNDESQVSVIINPDGTIPSGVVLQTPKLPPCTTYNVEADIPGDGSIDASAILSVAETTTSVTITKHDPYGNIIASKTVSWEWMKDNLPIIGDGETIYYIQKGTAVSDTFEAAWDPEETNTESILVMGNAQGTDVKDLLELAGGASAGDSVLFTASDNWQVWFDYENIYFPEPRQGKVVLAWWNGSSGGYVPEFYLGMRLYCFAETTNAAGQHIFGAWDMHETMPSSRWEYSPIGGCSSRLSNKYVRYIDIYEPNLYACDASGEVKSNFAAGETVYVKGLGLAANTTYTLWIQPDGVQTSPLDELDLRSGTYTLATANDPSGSQETVTTDTNGDFTPTAIWVVDNPTTTAEKYDIVADNQAGEKVGIYDTEDAVANPGWEAFTAPSAANATPSGNISWKLIGVIMVAVVIIVILLIVFFARRKPNVE